MDTRTVERFHAHIIEDKRCWVTDLRPNAKGYVYMWIERRMVRLHRWSYEHFIGPIPEGMVLDHTCCDPTSCDGGNTCPHRKCVNPLHLMPITNVENVQRGHNRMRERTHCPQGHEYNEENTRWYDGRRYCRQCK